MGNDISIICRTAVGALALLAIACSNTRQEPVVEPATPAAAPAPEASSPEAAATEPATDAASTTEAAPATATVELKPDAPLRYIVQKGDTLWGIASKFLKDSWEWPEVWYVNPKVKNPHLIYPGDELYLYFVNGVPQVAVAGTGAPQDTGPKLPPGGVSSFSPRVREEALSTAIYSIPLEKIRAFLQGPRLIDGDELKGAPYLIDFQDDHMMGGADNIAYALKLKDKSHAMWQIVRRGEKYKDPDNNDTIGYEVMPVADTEVRAYGDPATIYLRRSYMEALPGDYLLPMETDPLAARFLPHPPAGKVNGRIISVYNGMSKIGQYQIVALNRGAKHGMEPGTVLTVVQTGRESRDPYAFFFDSVQLPDIEAGTVMVFKVAPRMSYALVMDATRELKVLDKVERPGDAPTVR